MAKRVFLPFWPFLAIVYAIFLECTVATPAKGVQKEPEKKPLNEMVDLLEYATYVKQVVELLQSDDTFNSKINQNIINIYTGNMAKHLHAVPANIRSKLDEAKRVELERIKKLGILLKKQGRTEDEIKTSIRTVSKHLDLRDLEKFGTQDLKKLIEQANKNLAEIELLRKQRFKEYEMHKRLELEELVKRLTPVEYEKLYAQTNAHKLYMQHRKIKPIHLPMSKAHLLHVWEERDRMNKDNFNIRTFFNLHDLDDNGFLDEYEVKILVENEVLSKYDTTAPDFDPHEKDEEIERMREYSFTHVDVDKDHLITLQEFHEHIKREGMDDDHYWQTLHKDMQYTPKEFELYALVNRKEVNEMIDKGLIILPKSGIVQHNHPSILESPTAS